MKISQLFESQELLSAAEKKALHSAAEGGDQITVNGKIFYKGVGNTAGVHNVEQVLDDAYQKAKANLTKKIDALTKADAIVMKRYVSKDRMSGSWVAYKQIGKPSPEFEPTRNPSKSTKLDYGMSANDLREWEVTNGKLIYNGNYQADVPAELVKVIEKLGKKGKWLSIGRVNHLPKLAATAFGEYTLEKIPKAQYAYSADGTVLLLLQQDHNPALYASNVANLKKIIK